MPAPRTYRVLRRFVLQLHTKDWVSPAISAQVTFAVNLCEIAGLHEPKEVILPKTTNPGGICLMGAEGIFGENRGKR